MLTKLILSRKLVPKLHNMLRSAEMSNSRTSTKELAQLYRGQKQAECYVRSSPNYPSYVLDTTIKFYREKLNDFDLAVDVGCGSGQGTVFLAPHFKKVVGLDASEQQISQAPRDVANVSFHVSLADDLSRFQPGTVDLVTVAEAFHWFKHETFFREVTRVLKPGGSLVVYGYTSPSFSLPALNPVFNESLDKIAEQWPPEFLEPDIKYKKYSLPYPQWRRDDGFVMEKSWTIDEVVGYVKTLNPSRNFEGEDEILSEFKDRFTSACSDLGISAGEKLGVLFEMFMLMGHKPETPMSTTA